MQGVSCFALASAIKYQTTLNYLQTFFTQLLSFYRRYDFVVFTILTLASVLYGMTTPFYLIYFFWCTEFIHIVVDRIFYKRNPNATLTSDKNGTGLGSLFIMGIYFFFIVLIFGFIANFKNDDILIVNMNVLFFKNWFFNVNLMLVLVGRVFLHISKQPVQINLRGFTANMIILHISIIFGAFSTFFVVRNYPTIFTPDNLWGSVVIISPFLLLKFLIVYLITPKRVKIK